MRLFVERYSSIFWIAALVLCWIFSGVPIAAPTGTTGSITVIVQDPSGAIIPDAALELRDRGTNDVRNGSTQQSGAYTFPNLPFGRYQLTVAAPGFQKELFESIQVQTGR